MALLNVKKSTALALASVVVTFSSCFDSHKAVADDPANSDESSASSTKESEESMKFIEPPPPPADQSDPGEREAAASRGNCWDMLKGLVAAPSKNKGETLTALVPAYDLTHSGLVLGMTTVSHPTFFFYVPHSAKFSGKFVLQDEANHTLYQRPVSLAGTPGVIKVALSSTAPHLAINKRYHWYLNVYCQAEQPPIFVEGWVKRTAITPTLKGQLAKATQQKRAVLYAANGLWFDAITTVAELRSANPGNVTLVHEWVSLLHSVGLDAIASKPLKFPEPKAQEVGASLPLRGHH